MSFPSSEANAFAADVPVSVGETENAPCNRSVAPYARRSCAWLDGSGGSGLRDTNNTSDRGGAVTMETAAVAGVRAGAKAQT